MDLYYKSTRGKKEVTASQAILNGLAEDGGLYVPSFIPAFDKTPEELAEMDYRETAFHVMRLFLTDFTEEELRNCIDKAYDEKFDVQEIVPVVKKGNAYHIELYHGATIAFKDMALSILPHLMTTAAKKNGEEHEIVILTATSGDTGKAAMAGFADVPGTRIAVFYPKGGVSKVQERQMNTQKGDNTFVAAIYGNFDDAQTEVKRIFTDPGMRAELERHGFRFSSANSINVGRLVPQIVYYVYSYGQLVKQGVIKAGDKINIAVPTGNFGNILAAYYAKQMGLPVDRLICASNENKVLYDFFTTGEYNRNREFFLTTSPSMDILVSSNLERLIYRLCDEDPDRTGLLELQLSKGGRYFITESMKQKLADFYSGYASQEQTAEAIRTLFKETGFVIDPHTAVAVSVYNGYVKATQDNKPTLIASTASPYKFGRSVIEAIRGDSIGKDDFELIDELHEVSGVEIPEAVRNIRTAPIRHNNECTINEMEKIVKHWLMI